MNRRGARAVERAEPAMAAAVRESAGEGTAAAAVADKAEELGSYPGGGLLVQRLVVGQCYYVPTTTFPYVGRLASTGADYLELLDAAIVLYDGAHSDFMRFGWANNMEVEPTGGPGGQVFLPLDVVGGISPWPHPLFRERV